MREPRGEFQSMPVVRDRRLTFRIVTPSGSDAEDVDPTRAGRRDRLRRVQFPSRRSETFWPALMHQSVSRNHTSTQRHANIRSTPTSAFARLTESADGLLGPHFWARGAAPMAPQSIIHAAKA